MVYFCIFTAERTDCPRGNSPVWCFHDGVGELCEHNQNSPIGAKLSFDMLSACDWQIFHIKQPFSFRTEPLCSHLLPVSTAIYQGCSFSLNLECFSLLSYFNFRENAEILEEQFASRSCRTQVADAYLTLCVPWPSPSLPFPGCVHTSACKGHVHKHWEWDWSTISMPI